MKRVTIFSILIFISFSIAAQDTKIEADEEFRLYAKSGVGTSWLTFPKVFLVDENNVNNVWSISPALNNVTFFAGVQGVIRIGKHWVFAPEIDYHYLSGQVKIIRLENSTESRKTQIYSRIDVPINFGVVSSDNFWFEFGPVVYFTIADNKGFEEAVSELTQNASVDSSVPVGLAMRLGAVIRVSNRVYAEVKFDYDLGRKFEYNNGVYDVRIAMQGVTIGVGYYLNKK